MVSPFGFGSYRISEAEPAHAEALNLALTSGINLIDTSSNYGDESGAAEKLIGRCLSSLFESQKLTRQEVVIVSKVGYVQRRTLREAKLKIDNHQPWPEMVDYQDNCWHNISPEFIGDQLDHCLANLRIDCLDVLLLHNPEYFLKTTKQKDIYYSRIKKAFEFLETQVESGRIKYYGISSNTFADPETSFESTSVEKCFQIAKEIKKNNHFAVIEFPLNLYEHQAATLKNNSQKTVLEFAQLNKLGTLSNRPLNAILRGNMTRLVSYPSYDSVEVKGDMHRVLGRVIELEKKNIAHKGIQGLMWGHALRENLQQLDDILGWREVLYRQILPSLDSALNRLPATSETWAKEYRSITLELLALITKNLEGLGAQKSQILFDQVTAQIPEFKNSPSLSSQVLQIYSSLPISSVLVGMRTPEYVADCLKAQARVDEKTAIDALLNFNKK